MLKRLPTHWLASSLFLAAWLVAWPDQAQAEDSDQFNTSDQYDQFAVGGAHRWYDKHSTEAKEKSSHCLSILDEAKVYQDKAFALYAQAKQPGLASTQRTALRRQGMEQIRLRENKIRAFIYCFNLANRQKSQRSDQFATGGDSSPPEDGMIPTGETSLPPGTARRDSGKQQVPDRAPKSGNKDYETTSDVFSTNGDKAPSDEIQTQPHSDRPHGTPSDEIRTKPNPSDVLNTDPESRTAKNNSSLEETMNDSDCLPQIDSRVLVRLEAERNNILKSIAGGGYITELTLKTLAKLLVAHMHHLTEPNEGLLVRTTHTLQHSAERAPEAVVKAGQAVAQYFTNDTAANHRRLYGQVEKTVHKAENEIKHKLKNPHITIAEIADSFLVGKATGAVCQWTNTKIIKLRVKTDKAEEASKRLREVAKLEPPTSRYCGVGQDQKDCFWKAMVNATGDPSYLKKTHAADTQREIIPELKKRFGGANAKDPLTGIPSHQISLANGIPIPVGHDEFVDILYKRAPDGFEALVFVEKSGQTGHIFSVAKLKGEIFYWDNQQKTTNLDIMMMGGTSLSLYRYK